MIFELWAVEVDNFLLFSLRCMADCVNEVKNELAVALSMLVERKHFVESYWIGFSNKLEKERR